MCVTCLCGIIWLAYVALFDLSVWQGLFWARYEITLSHLISAYYFIVLVLFISFQFSSLIELVISVLYFAFYIRTGQLAHAVFFLRQVFRGIKGKCDESSIHSNDLEILCLDLMRQFTWSCNSYFRLWFEPVWHLLWFVLRHLISLRLFFCGLEPCY